MKLLILVSLIAAVAADTVRSYVPPPYSGGGHSGGGFGFGSGGPGFGSDGGGRFSGVGGISVGGGRGFSSLGGISVGGGGGFSVGSGEGCGPGQVRHVDGSCVVPQVTRNLYVFNAPEVAPIVGPPPRIPLPRVNHNVLFVHAADANVKQTSVVVPPAKEKNTVYVLQRRPEVEQDVIHLPDTQPETPDVFFVSYRDGDNPTLPTGEKLQDALVAASQGGSLVIGDGGIHGGGIGIHGGGGGIHGGAIGVHGGGGGIHGGGGAISVVGGGVGGSYSVTTPSTLYDAP